MSVPGLAVGYPTDAAGSWRALLRLVADAIAGPCVVSMDAIESSVGVPFRTRRSGAAARSNDQSPSRSPADVEKEPPGGVEAEHAEMWSLVRAAQAGDGDAFGKLYDRYVDSVFRFIFYRINDRARAEDFTSETFLRALRRISTINYQGRDIGAWFMTIARNIVFDHVKSARFRLELTTAEMLDSDATGPGPEATVLAHLTNERLMQAVNELGDEQKECIVLRFLNGLSVAETAEVMGKNDGAIKALQHRAIKRLASFLGQELR
jgi:RNA polymerase sigma-70 factor (ECF subfamily)